MTICWRRQPHMSVVPCLPTTPGVFTNWETSQMAIILLGLLFHFIGSFSSASFICRIAASGCGPGKTSGCWAACFPG
jgi:hypothetical protein